MRTPDQIREKLRTRWDHQWREWLGDGGQWPMRLSLDAPRETEALTRWPHFQTWLTEWSATSIGGELTLKDVRWPRLGAQQVPTHIQFASAKEVASALGPAVVAQFDRASQRWQQTVAVWPDLASVLRRWADYLARLSDADFRRFTDAFAWLVDHPNSGLFVRQIPVVGLHSKWIEAHGHALATLLAARCGSARTDSLHSIAGLAVDPPRRRIRLLDPRFRAAVGQLRDLTLPLPELANLSLRPRVVLVVENNQSALACGDLDDAVTIMGGGFAVSELAGVPWLADAQILYWGDIDTAGFAILHVLRTHWAHTRSVLMDEPTLLGFRELWSSDESASVRDLPTLTADESNVYQGLLQSRWGPCVRLEQERIPWEKAWPALRDAAGTGGHGG